MRGGIGAQVGGVGKDDVGDELKILNLCGVDGDNLISNPNTKHLVNPENTGEKSCFYITFRLERATHIGGL